MAANKTSFIKGQSGNPNGRPPLSEDQLKLKRSLKLELLNAIETSLLSTIEENTNELKNPSITGIEYVIRKAISRGDWKIIENCLDRSLGKPRFEEVPRDVTNMTEKEILDELKQLAHELL